MNASERNNGGKAVIRELIEADAQYMKQADAIILDADSSFLINRKPNKAHKMDMEVEHVIKRDSKY